MPKRKKNIARATDTPVPAGFIREMESLYGAEETERLSEAINGVPSVSVRVNRRKVADPAEFMSRFTEYGASPVPWCDSGFYLERRPDFNRDPLLYAGAYYVQEAASMYYETLVSKILKTLPREEGETLKVLDVCAAPGGKTTAILNALTGKYLLVANEYEPSRVRILRENLDRWGDPNVIITNSDSRSLARVGGIFDIVAVDAPCSGEGMMRREPVARTQWNRGLVESCSRLQREIVTNAVETLRPGGILIYSTCTFNRNENEQNAIYFEKEFGLTPLMEPRRFMPHRERCEGLFVSAFRKPEADTPVWKNASLVDMDKLLRQGGVKVKSCGIEQSVRKGELEIPSSRRVLAWDYDRKEFPEAPLSLEEARSYLQGNALRLGEDVAIGFVTVTYEGYPLGLVKNIGTRANNMKI